MNIFSKHSFLSRGPALPKPMVAAVLVSVVALAVSLGVARWSWLLLDEQIQLREDFMKLQNAQEQTAVQYEFWLEKLQSERAAANAAKSE